MTKNALNRERRNTMKGYVKEIAMAFLFVTIVSVGMLSGTSDVLAQDKGSTLEQQIQGSWTLVSIYNQQDGKKIEVFGPSPRGTMILTPDGRFAMILMNASLPKFASNIRTKGTTEENKAVVQGSIAYFGSYKVASEKENKVNLRIEGSTFPNWDGQEQQRSMTVIGNEMMYTNPTPALGSGTHYIVWKRVK
jgi:hypothetical protein